MIAAETQLRSIGRLANEVQVPVRRVMQIATSVNIQPAISLDGVAYFTDADSERLTVAIYAQAKHAQNQPTSPSH